MIKVIRNIKVYSPKYLGVKDVVIAADRIAYILDNAKLDTNIDFTEIDGTGKILVPGFIDSHVHLIGGGGEGSYKTRTPEIMLSDITKSGVTTVVGCLGTDGISRNSVSLLAKAKGLEEEGITTYIYSGSYRVPILTITGEIMKDIITIDKVIGAGEIALSDHRSSQPTVDEFLRLAADCRVAGMLSGKSGIINIHCGGGDRMIDMLFEIIEKTEIPITQFLPTHVARSKELLNEGIRFAKAGGVIDFTTSTSSEDGEGKCSKALKLALEQGVSEENITFSSDAQGSLPIFNEKGETIGLGVGNISSLFKEVKDCVTKESISLETALKVITENPARILKLKNKGRIEEGLDADLVLLTEKDLEVDTVISKGNIMVEDKKVIVKGTFE